MTESFIKLEQDNDIVMLDKDTFTVSRLKELMVENIKGRMFPNYLAPLSSEKLKITDKSIALDLNETRLVFPPNGIDGQLLQLKSGRWILGKIRFQVDVNKGNTVNTELEFAPDEIISNEEEQNNINYDNSLDKIRAELNEMKAI
jgi:KGK domain.